MKKNALLVIDVQKDYMNDYDSDLLNIINEHIRQADNNNDLIVYVKNTKLLRSGASTSELSADLEISSPHILCKEKASAFSNQTLLQLLQENAVSHVEIIGVDGNSCVAASAMSARKNGYITALPCRCIGVKNEARFEKKKEKLREAGIVITF